MRTFPISHQATVIWSALSALRHHSPDVSRPSVFSINSWGNSHWSTTIPKMWLTGKIFPPQPQHFNQQQTRVPCYNVSGRPDNYHCHYFTNRGNCQVSHLDHFRDQTKCIAFKISSPGSPQSHGSLKLQLSQVDVAQMCRGICPQPDKWHHVIW